MKNYNKLVRDRIPEIIEASGHKCEARILSDDEYLMELKNKLQEEVNEFLESGSVEELADIIEVVHSLSTQSGSSIESVEKMRFNKANERGGFKDKIFLKTVD
jgi:predicted house-cleaning noncanonical NTP pyrophosphatase (MazG superfamily)|tara:strand:+ start:3984 stop:4292 length:309 start_codon:yes stop_codon:yes gene_type:complete